MSDEFDLGAIDELIRQDALRLLDTFEGAFSRAVLSKDIDQVADVAAGLSETFRLMGEERRRVKESHPWRYGILLVWLSNKFEDEESGLEITRFSYLQARNFFDEYRSFAEFANEQTGVGDSEWNNWMNAVRSVLLSESGIQLLDRAGVTPDEFIRRVPMNKALRATGALGRGEMADFQIRELVDPSVSADRMRHVLRMSPEEYETEIAEREQRDREWLENPTDSFKVVWDPISRTLTIKGWKANKPAMELVARFSIPSSDRGQSLQDALIQFALEQFKKLT